MHKNQFIRFVLAGGTAALANFLSRIMLSFYLDYVPSIVFAYLIGMTTAYLICRAWVFEASSNTAIQQIGYFTLVNVFAVLQTVVISLIFANYIFSSIDDLQLRETMGHFIGICVPVFTSFLGHKYMTFKQ